MAELVSLLPGLLFYAFASCVVVAAGAVVLSKNPVYSVLLLIFCFFNAAGLFILLGAEFIAMLTVIVYVGAVAVLFLFVVMMLDIKIATERGRFGRLMPVGVLLAFALTIQIIGAIFYRADTNVLTAPNLAVNTVGVTDNITAEIPQNTAALGYLLYTEYFPVFQISGLILFLAMIGAITLTLHHKGGTKRQNISEQNARRREDGVRVVKVNSGEGVM